MQIAIDSSGLVTRQGPWPVMRSSASECSQGNVVDESTYMPSPHARFARNSPSSRESPRFRSAHAEKTSRTSASTPATTLRTNEARAGSIQDAESMRHRRSSANQNAGTHQHLANAVDQQQLVTSLVTLRRNHFTDDDPSTTQIRNSGGPL